jgi:aminopeptidase N
MTTAPKTTYLKNYQPPDYLIHQVELTFDLHAKKTRVHSTLTLQRHPLRKNQPLDLILLGEQLELISLKLNGKKVNPQYYQQGRESLTLQHIPASEPFIIEIENFIHPSANTALEGLYLSSNMLCTQCEAEGFRKITYYLDRPDVMAKFTTTLIGDKTDYPVLLSNGNQISAGDLDHNRHWVKWEDPFAKPCYLFALVAGQLSVLDDYFITLTGRKISLQIFVEATDKDKCDHAMKALKAAMAWDEKVYGREYDLDLYMIVAVKHFNMGAMENKGLNIFNTKFVLASLHTATDSDYEGISSVIAHEYFHNWSGNRVTCRDWFQLSLKEGFTVFRDQEFSADQGSRAVKRIEDVNLLRMHQFAEDAGPLAHSIRPESYIEINNFYTLTVYEKGAEVIRMLHTLLGAKNFRKGSDLYFKHYDGQAATCDDFIHAMETASDISLTQFKRWYTQVGTPKVILSETYDEKTQCLYLTFEQQHQAPEPLHIPLKLGLLNTKSGQAEPIRLEGETEYTDEIILSLTQTKQTFVFEGLEHQPIISVLRNFSAPIKLTITQSLETLAFLLRHDSDPFNRWEAGQKLSIKIILALIKDLQQGKALKLNPLFIKTFEHILNQHWDDLAYFSLLLELPDELYLAEQMNPIDVDNIHEAREFVKRQIAQTFQLQLKALYEEHHDENTISLEALSVGKRRLKNGCLAYLSYLKTKESQERIVDQLFTANNMTDQLIALNCTVTSQHPKYPLYLDIFYRQWQKEALVIDKWFTLQATVPHQDTFKKVQLLMQHPAFDLKTPNRMRALIGSFSRSNPICYHAKNGEGYCFLADTIIILDQINPQVASRMLTALTQWRRLDVSRQALMRIQLERILQTPNLSKDVYELTSKSLL